MRNKRTKIIKDKLENFMIENDVEMNDLNLDYIEKFILNYVKVKCSRAVFYDYIKCLTQILKENNVDIIVDAGKYVDECVDMKDIEKYRENISQKVHEKFNISED
ncbi:hypothetical protein [Terrisporobacter sp.]|uniref:hypothetical protein n=1 Tax=Terrisporobacter sp. TaxID=1965305 RepID=UPI0028A2C93E|nr:hypothetical protein [Terrisporobacter sp.]